MPFVAEDTPEEDRGEESALKALDGIPDQPNEQANHNWKEAGIHSPADSTFNGETKMPFGSRSRMKRNGNGAEGVGDEYTDEGCCSRLNMSDKVDFSDCQLALQQTNGRGRNTYLAMS